MLLFEGIDQLSWLAFGSRPFFELDTIWDPTFEKSKRIVTGPDLPSLEEVEPLGAANKLENESFEELKQLLLAGVLLVG